jgi:hypothetical protein
LIYLRTGTLEKYRIKNKAKLQKIYFFFEAFLVVFLAAVFFAAISETGIYLNFYR